MRIEPAQMGDLAELLALERATENAPHWAEAAYQAALDHGNGGLRRCLLVAWVDEKVVGFAAGSLVAGAAELESVAVSASARRQGVGRALCQAVVRWAWDHGAGEIGLEVRAGSSGARALYAGLGFVECGRRTNYYSGPVEDGVLMRLER